MKTNTMRAPLYKAGAVILIMALLAYLTSSTGGGVLDSVGLIIIGAFRLVQWAIAMVIGIVVCIAALIAIFLFAVSLYDKEASRALYARTKAAVADLLAPVFASFDSLRCKTAPCAPPARPGVDERVPLGDELRVLIAGEVNKVASSQQELNAQFASIQAKIENLEEKTANFAAAGQVEVIAGEIAASAKILQDVQDSVSTLDGKITDTAHQLRAMTSDKMLGDLPARLKRIEQEEGKGFDPQPLSESIQQLQKEVEELKKAQPAPPVKSTSGGRGRKKG